MWATSREGEMDYKKLECKLLEDRGPENSEDNALVVAVAWLVAGKWNWYHSPHLFLISWLYHQADCSEDRTSILQVPLCLDKKSNLGQKKKRYRRGRESSVGNAQKHQFTQSPEFMEFKTSKPTLSTYRKMVFHVPFSKCDIFQVF